jgi:drug/metabolite transporter (DMT)-like permease
MTWLLFSLISATCWAAVQMVDKTIIVNEAPSAGHYLFVSGLASLPVVAIGSTSLDVTAISIEGIVLATASGVCYFLVTAFLFHALVSLDASVAAAALATVPVLATAAAWPILGQKLTILSAASVLLITAGASIIYWRGRETLSTRKMRRAWFAVLGAVVVLVAEYMIDGYVVQSAPGPTVFYWTRVGVAIATFLFVAIQPRRCLDAIKWLIRRRQRVASLTFTNELLDMAGVASLIAAYSTGPVGLSTGVAYSSPAIVYGATLIINFAKPGLIPADGDRSNWISRGIGILLVVVGVLLATADQ